MRKQKEQSWRVFAKKKASLEVINYTFIYFKTLKSSLCKRWCNRQFLNRPRKLSSAFLIVLYKWFRMHFGLPSRLRESGYSLKKTSKGFVNVVCEHGEPLCTPPPTSPHTPDQRCVSNNNKKTIIQLGKQKGGALTCKRVWEEMMALGT